MSRKVRKKMDWNWRWLVPKAAFGELEDEGSFSWWRGKILGVDLNIIWGDITEIGLSFDYSIFHIRRILVHYDEYWGVIW